MSPSAVLKRENEAALRFLVAAGEATSRVLEKVASDHFGSPWKQYALTGSTGVHHVPSDLVSLGLADFFGGVYVPTDSGRRIIAYIDNERAAADQRETNHEPLTIIGIPSAPITYAGILTALAGLSEVLFVDPYLAAVDLGSLQRIPTVTRVLTGERLVGDRSEKGDRKTLLGIAAGSRPDLTVRTSTAIHDRYAIPSVGAGFILGASMGGKKLTTILELSDEAMATIRAKHEAIWADAAEVEPIVPPG